MFADLAIRMVGLGLMTGIAFPFFVLVLGVDARQALSVPFFAATVAAGLMVGMVNFWLSRAVVGERVRLLSARMRMVGNTIRHATATRDWSDFDPERCRVAAESDDEFGETASAFNQLVDAIERLHAAEAELELSRENTVMRDPARALDTLARLSELGIAFALDDFGTGYSSLAQLRRLPVGELKIDRSFVSGMTSNPGDATIVRSTVELGRNLGLHVVAEGVETAEQWRELAAIGCHTAQGYHLSRPRPGPEITRWILDRAPRPSAQMPVAAARS